MEAAKKVADYYGVRHIEQDLSAAFAFSDSSLLVSSKKAIPHQSYAEQLAERGGSGTVDTYVPFRNGVFLSFAAATAGSVGAETIIYGAHADDAAGSAYPDTSAEFNKAIADAIYLGSGKALRVVAPFIGKSKADVVAVGLEIGVPFAMTWSCYEGHEKACGVCGTCRDRKRAFQENGLADPIAYEM